MILDRIVLASASPRRLQLLRSLGVEVICVPSGYAEEPVPGLTPAETAGYHAREKLLAVLARSQSAGETVLAADTVVDLDGLSLNKPLDAGDARTMLSALSGRDHLVHTAYALRVPEHAERIEEISTTRVRFHHLTQAEIGEYIATGEPFDKAGAYGIQGRAAALVEGIEGDFYTVMGLPLGRVVRVLRRLGFALPAPK